MCVRRSFCVQNIPGRIFGAGNALLVYQTNQEATATFLIGIGCGKPLFHPKHKPGIFCYTLSYRTAKIRLSS